MTIVKKPISKQDKKDSFFDAALNHVHQDKGKLVSKVSKATEGETRTNFDCPDSLRAEIKIFLANNSKKFKSNKEFFIQCIKDGLEKYKD